jgi:hypothetical protein
MVRCWSRPKRDDLGSLSQRVAALGVSLPPNPADVVAGVYQLQSAPNVLVASSHRMYAGEQDFPSEPTFKAIPLNATAIAYFGTSGAVDIHPYDAAYVTLSDLQEAMKPENQ